jgi:hypothetical protein
METPEIQRLRAAGCRRVLAKVLAENDNSKNQIYLGGSFDLLNELPLHSWTSETTGRRGIIRASIDWSWLQPDGSTVRAPGAQLILYPQYPEVRLSGILRGTPRGTAPNATIARRQAGRILLLGLHQDGTVIGLAVPAETRAAEQLRRLLADGRGPGALIEAARFTAADAEVTDTRTELLHDLLRIHRAGWVDGRRMLPDGSLVPYHAINGVGYTLEALLGVRPNAIGEPDHLGWEVKALTATGTGRVAPSKRITLMTPSPTGGHLHSLGPAAFVHRWGHPDRTMPRRLNFGGTFNSQTPTGPRSLQLELQGFNPAEPSRFAADGALTLRSGDGHPAMQWTLAKMIELWNRKHSKAVYVPAEAEQHGAHRRYRYGARAYLGTGTDFTRLLLALADGQIVYDPGIKLESSATGRERTKVRHQFRVAFGMLPALYAKWEEVALESRP